MHYNIVPWQWDFVISLAWHKCEKSTGTGILGSGGPTGEFLVPGIRFKELMQFTGLHDKNGKEIYEWDIVFDGGINKVIIWKGGGFNVQHPAYKPNSELPTRPLWMDSLTHGEQLQMEVIGNIYENPELLDP